MSYILLKKNNLFSSGYAFNVFAVVCLCLVSIFIYSNTFQSPFAFDDNNSIVNNDHIKNLANLYAVWEFDPTHLIAYLSLAINYHFHQLQVLGYHLVNLIIHITAVLFVWWLSLLTFSMVLGASKDGPLAPAMNNKEVIRQSRWLALFSGLLFAVHPVQTEAVTYIIQRGTSLAALFYIASLTLYIKARLLINKNAAAGIWKWFYGLSLLCAVLGMFTKQIVVTLPLIICLYEFCFLKGDKGFKWKYTVAFLALLLIIPANVALAKKAALWNLGELTKESDVIARGIYLLTQFRVLTTYLRLFFVPLNQILDYDYPLSKSLGEVQTLSSLLLLLSVLVTGIMLFRRYRLISFSIFWFFLTLLVESSLISICDVIYEHRLYLPMVSYALFLPAALYYLCGQGKRLRLGFVLLIILIGFYAVLAYNRNLVWRSESALWSDAVNKSPGKARPYNGRGVFYHNQGLYDKAFADYNQALKIDPHYADAYYNRGNTCRDKGEYDKALSDYSQALKMDPNHIKVYNNRGNLYFKMNLYDKALSDFDQALKTNPRYSEIYYNRGNAYFKKGDYGKALRDYNQAIAVNPGHIRAYNNRGNLYLEKGDYDKAVSDFNQILKKNPRDAEAHINRGSAYLKKGAYDKALIDYNQALDIEPDQATVYYNRASFYLAKKDYDKAVLDFSQVLKITPDNIDAYSRRAFAFYMKKDYAQAWADVVKMQSLGYEVDPVFLEKLQASAPALFPRTGD